MNNKWIHKGDKVLVISGNDKGKDGSVLSRKGDRIVIQGINLRKKHMKRTQQNKGQIMEIEEPIHVSNITLCDATLKPIKLRTKKEGKGKSLVYTDASGKEVLFRDLKKR